MILNWEFVLRKMFLDPPPHFFSSTTCDYETSTTHFPVSFGPIFQIVWWNFFRPFFPLSVTFDHLKIIRVPHLDEK